ncbi:MAG TPA: DNA replication and repair protein RecF, partial [Candidatus Saccharimonadia bacterium]|nr:DNA replication and repair protein RecF [Candidatus Saccharimonadia bacterium]
MITDIHLQKFRSYYDSSFDFDPGVNIIVGQNGSGKTNLLESIMMVSQGASYRAKDHHMILNDELWARLEAHTKDQTRVVKIENIGPDKYSKTFEINDQIIRKLNLEQKIPIILFEPNHLQLLTGGPEARREYLDSILEQTVVGYRRLRLKYKRLLTQRNNLLKTRKVFKQDIFVWNVQLSEVGGQINKHRFGLTNKINDQIIDLYKKIAGSELKLRVHYSSELKVVGYETALLSKLENYTEDVLRGHTLHGPHLDDMRVYIGDTEAGLIASRGETRTILLALKLIETKIVEDNRNKKPILLLDDVFG